MDASPGIYALHKPAGPSSFACLKDFRATFSERTARLKALHGGTLDPFAEGLLLVLVGGATQLFELIHELPKTYVATLAWGRETDTGDALGRTVGDISTQFPDARAVDDISKSFLGWTQQVPPATSAKKVGGEPAYRKAHRGESVELEPSRVFLGKAQFTHGEPSTARVELVCRGGFYVRSWATELGRRLGCGAHVVTLERRAIGPFVDPSGSATPLFRGTDCLPWLGSCQLSDADVGRLRSEGNCPTPHIENPVWKWPRDFPAPTPLIAGLHGGTVVALLEANGPTVRLERFLPRGI